MDVFTNHKSFQYVFTLKEINLRQIRLLELLKNYDMSVLYHPDKDNAATDPPSGMTMSDVSHVE